MTFHLSFLQQFCGINIAILYGGEILNDAIPGKGNFMQIFLNCSQLIGCILTAYVMSKLGRKILIQLGTVISIIVLIGLGIAYLQVFY